MLPTGVTHHLLEAVPRPCSLQSTPPVYPSDLRLDHNLTIQTLRASSGPSAQPASPPPTFLSPTSHNHVGLNLSVRHLKKTRKRLFFMVSGGMGLSGGLCVPCSPLRTVKLYSHPLILSPSLANLVPAAALPWKATRTLSNQQSWFGSAQLTALLAPRCPQALGNKSSCLGGCQSLTAAIVTTVKSHGEIAPSRPLPEALGLFSSPLPLHC